MEPSKIIYRKKTYYRQPSSSRRQHRVYYYRHTEPIPFALHRQIWIDNFGAIPSRYVVHHKDHNTFNNKPDNLQLLSPSEHASHHFSQPEQLAKAWANLELIRDKAKIWHGSKDGKEWHSKHGKQTWVGRVTFKAICQVCSKSYQTFFPTRSKNCSSSCKDKSRRLQ